MHTLTRLSLFLFGCIAATANAAVVYDAAADFSIADNPNDVWSYGFSTASTGPFAPFTLYAIEDTDAYGVADLHRWSRDAGVDTDFPDVAYPFVLKNVSSSPQPVLDVSFATGQMTLHPGELNEASIVRWTAPGLGLVDIAAVFTGLSELTTTTDVHVYHNDTALFDADIDLLAATQGFNLGALPVAAGDTLRFIVGSAGDFISDTTALDATVSYTAVPETSAIAFMGVAAAIAGVVGWKRLNVR